MGSYRAAALLIALLALAAGCAGDPGSDGGDAETDATGDAPHDAIDRTVCEEHRDALESAGSYTLLVTGDVVIETGSTARIEERHAVDLEDNRYLKTQTLTSGGEPLTSTSIYVPSVSWDTESPGYERISVIGRSEALETTVNVPGEVRRTPVNETLADLDYGDPIETTLDGSTAYRYDALSPSATVNATETGSVQSASLYLDPDGVIRRLEFEVQTDMRTIEATYRYVDIGSTEVETPDWVPE